MPGRRADATYVPMTEKLANEALFDAAVRKLGGRSVFDEFGKPPTGQTADWVFPERRLIIEHKHIEAEYAESAKFRAGRAALQAILTASPKAAADLQEFGRGILRLFEPAFAERLKIANQQIKSTKTLAGWPDAHGVVVIANRSLLSLPPKWILSVLQELLTRPRYSGVDAVIYQSDHFVSGPDDDRDQAVWAAAMRPGRPPALADFIDALGDSHKAVLEAVAGPFDFHVKTSNKNALKGLMARRQGPAGA